MKHRTQLTPEQKSASLTYISGFLEGKFFLNQRIPVSKTLLWAGNDFARGFRAGYFGDDVVEIQRRKAVSTAGSVRPDRRKIKR